MSEKPRSERAVAAKSKEKEKEQAPEDRSLPVLPVRDTVLFPHAVLPLTVGRESSVPRTVDRRRRRCFTSWWRSSTAWTVLIAGR